jgi:tripartite-type tricarboxylate transporter receptor subunit TctC
MNPIRIATAAAALVALLVTDAAAQYPNRPVKIVVGFPPGGAPDLSARVLSQKLSDNFGQPVLVENRPGANSNIAGDIVAKGPPDGYTLLLGPDTLITINPHLYSRMTFDTQKDLVPVTSLVSNALIMSVNPTMPAKTFAEFVEHARRTRPPIPYASIGSGSHHHLAMEMLKQRAGVALEHVPYKGGAPAAIATIAGEVSVLFGGTSTLPQIKSGQLRALASTGKQRSKEFPELPTIGEFYPGYEVTIWLGLFAPAGTPEPVLARLRSEVGKALAAPDVIERLKNAGGLEPFISPPPEFAALIRRDFEKYGKLVKDVGAKVD